MQTISSSHTQLLNEFAVAEILDVSVATIRRWRLLQRGPRFVKIGAAVRYKREDVTSWLESRPTGGEQATGSR